MAKLQDAAFYPTPKTNLGTSDLKARMVAVAEFLKSPTMVGSSFPASHWLIDRMLQGVDWPCVNTMVEYGPGTGVFTSAILARLQPCARLIAIDTSPSFTDHLASAITDERLHVVTGSAADVQHIMAELGLLQADCIISGLPFSTLEPEVATQIIDGSVQILSPDGVFMAYQMRTAVRALLERRFDMVRAAYEWRNIPPCHLYWASKPDRQRGR
jgi:phospholipid N-methyltransferase